jgi:hypothetical protein
MRLFSKFPSLFVGNTSEFIKLSVLLKKGLATQWNDIGNTKGRLLWLCCLPIGYTRFVITKLKK